jgi:hypothetical protein
MCRKGPNCPIYPHQCPKQIRGFGETFVFMHPRAPVRFLLLWVSVSSWRDKGSAVFDGHMPEILQTRDYASLFTTERTSCVSANTYDRRGQASWILPLRHSGEVRHGELCEAERRSETVHRSGCPPVRSNIYMIANDLWSDCDFPISEHKSRQISIFCGERKSRSLLTELLRATHAHKLKILAGRDELTVCCSIFDSFIQESPASSNHTRISNVVSWSNDQRMPS